jgi:predicted ribosomally synthesized peptide with SipW-like signal peptide
MNKRIMMSALSIMSALTIMGGATYAAFSDTATLTNNTFASGDASIQISVTNNTEPAFGDTKPGFVGAANFFPGHEETFQFWIRNISPSPITLNTVAKFTGVTGNEDLQDNLLVTFNCTGTGVVGPYTVNQWEAGSASIATLPQNSVGTDCTMKVAMPLSAPNTVQNQPTAFNVLFTGTQI